MIVSKLSLVNFKNYKQLSCAFNPHINCLLGDNGEGKTNVLDAIYISSFCKSYFNAIDSHNIRFEEEMFMVQTEFSHDDEVDEVLCSVKKGRKKVFKRNKVDYTKLSDHIGRYPVIMITPYDSNLVLGGSDLRRKFLDTIISQVDPTYLNHLMAYNKVLDQRNALLKNTPYGKEINLEVIDIYDSQLIQYGSAIAKARGEFVRDNLIPKFNELHKTISDGKEQVNLTYLSSVEDGKYEMALKSALDKDRSVQHTTVGIHKDDLLFQIEDYPLKKFGSQGQQKSYLIALKLAYYLYIKSQLKLKPILLLDDIFDKLDKNRVMALLRLVTDEEQSGQVFITDTSLDRVPTILDELNKEYTAFEVKGGELNEA